MSTSECSKFVSRGGTKLEAALGHFNVDVAGRICADLGSHVGGFVDCLLQRKARRVYSVDTCYGTLAWKLRKDARVVVFERTNAMHVSLPEPVELVTIDVGWTRQERILPQAAKIASDAAVAVTLIKPHYEAPKDQLVDGVLPEQAVNALVAGLIPVIEATGWLVVGTMPSPLRGHGGNVEVFALLTRAPR